MSISVGEVTQAIPSKRAYLVNFFDNSEQLCRLGNYGVDVPLKEGDQVLCVKSDTPVSSGWVILCRLDYPSVGKSAKKIDEDRTKSKEKKLAEEQEDLISKAVGGYEPDGIPDWGWGDGEDPAVYGEILAKSRTSEGFQKILSDGSIVNFVDAILHFVLAKYNKAAILRAKQLILDIIPGFYFNITPVEDIQLPKIPDSAQKPDKRKMRIEAGIAPDPEDNILDFFLEAGLLFDRDDPGYGKSTDTTGKRIQRGLRVRIGDFAIFEIDVENKEIRLTSDVPGVDPTDLYQIRLNQSEFVVSWGKQFMSFRDDGILLKGDLIGLAGPWAMWSKTITSSLLHNTELSRDQMQPVAEWKEDGTGIKFNKSVYFGDNEELAVLQSFIKDVYDVDKKALGLHFHTYTPPALVTLTSPALQLAFKATDLLTEDPAISKMLSDVFDLNP